MEGYTGEGPKWRLEHTANNRATCQQASCKRSNVKIEKGELRIGTRTLFDRDGQQTWYIAWRHWGCATKHQLRGLKETTDNDVTKAPGYHCLSPESQEQVRLAFENDRVTDKAFKGISEDLAKHAPKYGGEISGATGYKVDVARRVAACRGSLCQTLGMKIPKGELRLGIFVDFHRNHNTTIYKHWKCISKMDLEAAKGFFQQGSLDGINDLSDEFKQVVLETFQKDKVAEPLQLNQEVETRKSRAKKRKAEDEDEDKSQIEGENDNDDAPKPKRIKKKAMKEVQTNGDTEASEAEYVPRKTRSRRVPFEEINPTLTKAQPAAEQM